MADRNEIPEPFVQERQTQGLKEKAIEHSNFDA
jgi:hypothetical protein